MNNLASASAIEQAKISAEIRTDILREASANGGLALRSRNIGINAHRYYNQMNRSTGVLVETVVLEHLQGNDKPLQIVNDACDHYAILKTPYLRKLTHPLKSVERYCLMIINSVVKISMAYEEAMADETLDKADKITLRTKIHDAIKRLLEFDARINEVAT